MYLCFYPCILPKKKHVKIRFSARASISNQGLILSFKNPHTLPLRPTYFLSLVTSCLIHYLGGSLWNFFCDKLALAVSSFFFFFPLYSKGVRLSLHVYITVTFFPPPFVLLQHEYLDIVLNASKPFLKHTLRWAFVTQPSPCFPPAPLRAP